MVPVKILAVSHMKASQNTRRVVALEVVLNRAEDRPQSQAQGTLTVVTRQILVVLPLLVAPFALLVVLEVKWAEGLAVAIQQ